MMLNVHRLRMMLAVKFPAKVSGASGPVSSGKRT
jgi:hypothetical protein